MPVNKGSKFKHRRKQVYGWGINDSTFQLSERINGVRVFHPVYSRWISIVQRGFDPKEKSRKRSYEEVSVDERWQHITDFQKWLDTQPGWEELELDKDILYPGNKLYGPDTCVFVPSYINKLIPKKLKDTGLLRGVGLHKNGKFIGQASNRKRKQFETEQEAHHYWQIEYALHIQEQVNKYSKESFFNSRVADALLKRAWDLRLAASKGGITHNFM